MKFSKIFFDSILSSSADVINYNSWSLILNHFKIIFNTYLGNRFDFTALIKSGISKLLSYFIVFINFLYFIYLKVVIHVDSYSSVLLNSSLLLLKAYQSTNELYPVCCKIASKFFSMSSIVTSNIFYNYIKIVFLIFNISYHTYTSCFYTYLIWTKNTWILILPINWLTKN